MRPIDSHTFQINIIIFLFLIRLFTLFLPATPFTLFYYLSIFQLLDFTTLQLDGQTTHDKIIGTFQPVEGSFGLEIYSPPIYPTEKIIFLSFYF